MAVEDNVGQEPLRARARTGAVWSTGTSMLLRLANVLVTVVMARILTPDDFGVFAVAAAVFVILSTFQDLGTAAAIRRADLDLDKIAPTVVTMTLVSGWTLAAFIAATANFTAEALKTPEAAGPIRVLALVMAIGAPMMVPLAQLGRDFRQRRIFIANAAAFIPANAAMILLALNGSGAMAFAWSRVVGQIVIAAVVIFSVTKHYFPGFDRGQVGVLVRYGLPLAAAALLSQLLLNLDYVFIARMMNPTEVGLYMLAFNIAGWAGAMIVGAIEAVTVPAISRLVGDPARLASAIVSGLRLTALLSLPVAALTLALSVPLVTQLYGSDYAASAPALAALAPYGALASFAFLLSHVLMGQGRSGVLLIVQIMVFIVFVPALWFGIEQAGIVGAALAHSLVILVATLPVYVGVLLRHTQLRIPRLWVAVWPPLLSAIVSALAAWAVSLMFTNQLAQLVVGGTAGMVVWVALSWSMLYQFVPEKVAGAPVLRSVPRPERLAFRA